MTAVEATPVTEESKKQPLALRVGAELVGSFFICFAIYTICTLDAIVSNLNMAFIALLTGAAYAVMILIFGRISGGQFNPAVSIAAMLTGKTRVLDGILYIIAQLLGGIGAGAAIRFLLPTSEQVPFKSWLSLAVNGFDKASISYSTLANLGLSFGITLAVVVELIAGLIIAATAMRGMGEHDESNTKYAVAMGLAYAVGTTITYPVTGAALNPARATGIAIFAQNQGLNEEPLQQLWVFWICPVLAAAVVALVIIVAAMISSPNKKGAKTEEGDDAQEEVSAETDEELHADGEQDEQDKQSDAQGNADEGVERD
ncbi:MIP/aquaporin family protein [Bifidobacterium moukalabense]|uniref:MIP family major intrinsic protein channel protein n=1 Tax=Bifidobacterium moukalabense DSM 27321 TaxID=1435051 RepID=W4NAS8_9BIFI|nr:aquaporin [Bifidobacterium moukalabense]ETY71576.1 MIP family major intrinsic protein channel protein [Bifidobacterium moukalabense DSM 27321]